MNATSLIGCLRYSGLVVVPVGIERWPQKIRDETLSSLLSRVATMADNGIAPAVRLMRRCGQSRALSTGGYAIHERGQTDSYEIVEPVVFKCQPTIERTHLLYHVCPLKSNDVWVLNVRQLQRRIHVFTGRKVIAVAQGPGLHSLSEVAHMLDGADAEFIAVPNDPQLREVASFEVLLRAVESTDPGDASFYAHTKGNSTAGSALGVEFWRNAMYHHLLDGYCACLDLLSQHPCVGTHKMMWSSGSPYPSGLLRGNWMYAGTFFWFRHRDVFTRAWCPVPHDRYGAEAWLSGFVAADEAATVYQPWPAHRPVPNAYDPSIYMFPLRDM